MATLPSPGSANRGFLSTDPELAAVDASVRTPVMLCFLSAVHWMVVGTVLLVYASSLTHPQDSLPILGLLVDLSNSCSFFTYGHVWPAAIDALVYGWASTAGFGLAIWVLARTGRSPVKSPGLLLTGIIFWNIGVAIGLSSVLVGVTSSVEFLEFPLYSVVILWLAYIFLAIAVIASYLRRKPGSDHIAQIWILIAIFTFPWLFAAGGILLSGQPLPGSGVIQELLNSWYVHGILTLWIAPLGLGVLYYLIPKMSGIGIRYGNKAWIALWVWLVVAPWTAVHDLVGGPFPADPVMLGLIFSGMIFLPVAIIGMNLIGTAFEGEEKQGSHGGVVLPFLTLAAVVFVLAGASEQLLSIRSINEILRFTLFRECNQFLWVYGFFSYTAFGAIYYIVPRLLNFGWRSAFLIKVHYYSSLYGILLLLALLTFGGIMQGVTAENPDINVTIVTINDVSLPFYIATTMCLSLISLGNGIFALHLGWMLLDWFRLQIRANRLTSEILLEPYEPHPEPSARTMPEEALL